MTKRHHPISLLSVVSKIFEKLANNRLVDHQEMWSETYENMV